MRKSTQKLTVRYLPVDKIKPRPTNPRTHSKKQMQQIAASIQEFGFTNPILLDDEDLIIAGHGRVEAAKLIGLTDVPTIKLSNMTEAQVRAYVIADNKLAENAGWDRKLLALEFQYLGELNIDLDLALTGFELPEIDLMISELSANDNSADEPPVPAVGDGPAVSRLGDLWVVGEKHKLFCGDATDAASYQALLGDAKAQMVFSDPPYNVPIDGHVSGLGLVQHREFAMASGEMSQDEFTSFLSSVFRHLAAFSVDGAIHFQCIDWRHTAEMHAAGSMAYSELKNICVWAKTNAGMGSLYRSQHELVYVFKSGSAPHINNVALGKHGRNRTNVWSYAGVNSFGKTREDLKLHPTVKPVAMVADAIRDCSHRKGIVLDPFLGSGTTMIAAEQTGRLGYGIELDPLYCDVSLRRLQTVCGLEARLASTGQTFEVVAAERAAETARAAENAA